MPLVLIFLALVSVDMLHRHQAGLSRPDFPPALAPQIQRQILRQNRERDGLSFAHAIILPAMPDELCDPTEHAWLAAHFPNASEGAWHYFWRDKKAWDTYELRLGDGRTVTVYFDVTKIIQNMPDMTKPPPAPTSPPA